MDTYLDIYCERTSQGLWQEPLNLVSNLVFIAAAILAWFFYRANLTASVEKSRDIHLEILIALLFVVGVGSGLFHSFATKWAQIADVAPIACLVLASLLYLMRSVLLYGWGKATCGFLLLVTATGVCTKIPSHLFNGSQLYFATVGSIAVLAYSTLTISRPLARSLIGVFVLMLAALFCRSIDMAICPRFPWGTHFLWHSLNGVAIFVLLRGLIRFRFS